MRTSDLINALRAHETTDWDEHKLTQYFMEYCEQLDMSYYEEHPLWEFSTHGLERLFLDACHMLEESQNPLATDYRYQIPVNERFTGLMSGIGCVDAYDLRRAVSNVFAAVTGRDASGLKTLMTSESDAFYEALLRFKSLVYVEGGMSRVVDACETRGMSGTAGNTTLRTYRMAGRVVMTFHLSEDIFFTIKTDDAVNPTGVDIHCVRARLDECLRMLYNVEVAWRSREMTLSPSESVGII